MYAMKKSMMLVSLLAVLCGCRESVPVLPEEGAAVRDYVPLYAVLAHRGSTYWAPEETESAWRWAREMGADYLESDLQCTKDGIILANHDENLTRTTDIAARFGDSIPATRLALYRQLGFSEEDARAQLQRDQVHFRPYYAASYYYAELLTLDAGGWFNAANPDRPRKAFANHPDKPGCGLLPYTTGEYVSALQDQIAYAEGKRLRRDADGRRILPWSLKKEFEDMTLAQIAAQAKEDGKYMECIQYDFGQAYEADPQDSGHRPGIYIEFKEPEVNPIDMEERVYAILDQAGWNILTRPATESAFYKDGKVNVGRTQGKVILQTFSTASLKRAHKVFQGKIPMCFLLWPPCPEDIPGGDLDTRKGYIALLKWAQENGAHIIGPAIAGEPNNYAELNEAWQAELVREAGMLNHPYSFDTLEQMDREVSRGDGFFTNRSEMTLQYLLDHGLRGRSGLKDPFHPDRTYDNAEAPGNVPDAKETLDRLGY